MKELEIEIKTLEKQLEEMENINNYRMLNKYNYLLGYLSGLKKALLIIKWSLEK